MRALTLFFSILISNTSFACDEPISGQKYNKLITISQMNLVSNTQKINVTFPEIVEGREHIDSLLIYTNEQELTVPLMVSKSNHNMEGTFEMESGLVGEISISIMWGGNQPCPIWALKRVKT